MESGLFIIAHIAALLHASSSLGPFTTSVICNAKSALSVQFSPSLPDTLRLGETPPPGPTRLHPEGNSRRYGYYANYSDRAGRRSVKAGWGGGY